MGTAVICIVEVQKPRDHMIGPSEVMCKSSGPALSLGRPQWTADEELTP